MAKKDPRLAKGPRVLGIYHGELVSDFGDVRPNAPAQRVHAGWDVAAPPGVYIRALDDGQVVRARWNGSVSGYRQEVTVFYPAANVYVLYGHILNRATVRAGQLFAQGDILALVGTSYDAMGTTPHAHVQCWKSYSGALNYSNDSAIDPQRLENFYA